MREAKLTKVFASFFKKNFFLKKEAKTFVHMAWLFAAACATRSWRLWWVC
jgi:hypothetical protein